MKKQKLIASCLGRSPWFTEQGPFWVAAPILIRISLWILPAAVALLSLSSRASEATVIKVKGKQAIVQFPNDYVPAAGEKIEVGPVGRTSSINAESAGSASRAQTVGLSANISILSNSTSGSSSASSNSTDIDLSGRYGWNMEIIELGPTLGLSYLGSGGAHTTTIQGGGFIDYNLLPNRQGVKFVAGLHGEGYLGQSSPSGGSSSSLMGVAGGGQMKWFCFGEQTALRGDLLASYTHVSSTVTTTQTGMIMELGLQTYF